jgi:hypothetical protein
MWKSILTISLTTCVSAIADDTPAKPSVFVECCGRLRHGMVAIGGESTGTTITFNRIIWELQLNDDADRVFAEAHHKKPVVVTGALRKVQGMERKDRWIIDVKSIREGDSTKDKEGTRLAIQGLLQPAKFNQADCPDMTVTTGGHTWPVDWAAATGLQTKAKSLVGQSVVVTGILKPVTGKECDARKDIIQARTLKQSAKPMP